MPLNSANVSYALDASLLISLFFAVENIQIIFCMKRVNLALLLPFFKKVSFYMDCFYMSLPRDVLLYIYERACCIIVYHKFCPYFISKASPCRPVLPSFVLLTSSLSLSFHFISFHFISFHTVSFHFISRAGV